MKFIIHLAAFLSLSFFVSCGHLSKTETAQEEVFFDDGYRATSSGEINIEDGELGRSPLTGKKQINAAEAISTKNAQGAIVSTMTDSAGNKSESVCYDNHPLVGCVVLKTAVKGEKEILVYARNGTVKTLPADKIDDIFTASADEAARAAEITEGRNYAQTQAMFAQKPQNSAPLQPMPSYKFNVQQPAPVETGQTAAAASAAAVEPKVEQTEEQPQPTIENRPPDQQKEN